MKDTKDRKTLKGYFKKGSIPTEEQFATLIDSVPNIAEDGQAIRTTDGWSFFPEAGKPLQIHLHDEEGKPAAWTLCLTPEKGLAVKNEHDEIVAELTQDKSINLPGKGKEERNGSTPVPVVPEPVKVENDYITLAADEEWHDLLTVTGNGFRMYDVFLFLHDSNTRANKETRATAVCIGSVNCRIRSPRKHWWGWSGGIRLRWQTEGNTLRLQARSKRYRSSGKIFCKII